MTVPKECRELLARLEMLDELLGADPPCRAIRERQRTARVPRDHFGSGRMQIEVDETCQHLRPARDVDVQVTFASETAQPATPRR